MKQHELTVGQAAPQFKTVDALGQPVDLADFNEQFVLLVFLRYSGCPLCNLTLHRLTLEYPMLAQNGCQVIAFVQSAASHIQENVYHRHKNRPQYPIIPDAGRKFYDQYGVQNSAMAAAKSIIDIPYWIKSSLGMGYKQTAIDGDLLLVPAMFLIGPGRQEIVKAEYGSSFYEHRTFTSIYEPLIFK